MQRPGGRPSQRPMTDFLVRKSSSQRKKATGASSLEALMASVPKDSVKSNPEPNMSFCSQQESMNLSQQMSQDIQMTPDCAVFSLKWEGSHDHSARLMPPTPRGAAGQAVLSQAEGPQPLIYLSSNPPPSFYSRHSLVYSSVFPTGFPTHMIKHCEGSIN